MSRVLLCRVAVMSPSLLTTLARRVSEAGSAVALIRAVSNAASFATRLALSLGPPRFCSSRLSVLTVSCWLVRAASARRRSFNIPASVKRTIPVTLTPPPTFPTCTDDNSTERLPYPSVRALDRFDDTASAIREVAVNPATALFSALEILIVRRS